MISIILALVVVYFAKDAKAYTEIPAKLYLSFLQMGITPLIFTSVSLAIINIFQKNKNGKMVKSYVYILLIGAILVSVAGIILSLLTDAGAVVAAKKEIKELIEANFSNVIEITKNDPIEALAKVGIKKFLQDLIPSNIFAAFSNGRVDQVIIFAIVSGAAMGFFSRNQALGTTYHISLKNINMIFKKIVDWALSILPLGVFFVLVTQLSNISWPIILSLTNFVLMNVALLSVFTLISALVIAVKSQMGIFRTLGCLKESALIAFTTGNSFAVLTPLSESMSEELEFDRQSIDLLFPLGLGIVRFGTILYFSCLIIFLAQLYNVPLGIADYFLVVFGSITAASAASSTGIVNLKLLSIMAIPLGLPIELGLVLFAAVDTFVDPFRTLCTVFMNAGGAALAIGHKDMHHVKK